MKNYNFLENRTSYSFRPFSCSAIDFDYFSVNFGAFGRLWKNQEIQDGGTKMPAVWERDVILT